MADFPTALDTALRGHYGVGRELRSPVTSARGFQARVRALEGSYGTKKAAAAAAGVSPSTWGRWATGKQKISDASRNKVAAAYTALKRAAKVDAKGPITKLHVEAVVAAKGPNSTYRNRHRGGWRTFRADRLTAAALATITGAFKAGRSPRAVADVAYAEIKNAYGSPFEFEGETVFVEVD